MSRIIRVLLLVPSVALSLICTSCPFTLSPPFSTVCNETCEGDLCYIVVNKHFNGTVIAGCLSFRENEEAKNNTAVCNRGPERTMCACTTSNKCNDPTAPISEFDFVEETILDGYQVLPQILPSEPTNPEIQLNSPSNQTSRFDESLPTVTDNNNINHNDNARINSSSSSRILPVKDDSDFIVTKTVGLQIVEDGKTTISGNFPKDFEADAVSSEESARNLISSTPTSNSSSTRLKMMIAMIVTSFMFI